MRQSVGKLVASFMSAILELPEVRARLKRLSVETFEALADMGAVGKRTELIRGLIVEKMPKSPLHTKLVKRIFLFLLALERAGFVVFFEASLRLSDSMPEPDIMVLRGQEGDFDAKLPRSAELVVKVAVSSAALDRENSSMYAEAAIPEYWIVLAEEHKIEVYSHPSNGIYQHKRLYSVGETVTSEAILTLQVPVAEWFA